MGKDKKIDWWSIGLTVAVGTGIGYTLMGLSGVQFSFWMWAFIPMWSFLMGLTLQVMRPTGAPKPWFRKEDD